MAGYGLSALPVPCLKKLSAPAPRCSCRLFKAAVSCRRLLEVRWGLWKAALNQCRVLWAAVCC
jgi:hypothetical protein